MSPNAGTAPDLSIVIPAFNEERRLPRTLAEIARWVQAHGMAVEVLVVENGSHDATVDVVRRFQVDHPWLGLIAGVPRGKGRAVREGMLAARGRDRFLCDADLSMPIDELGKFLDPRLADADVVLGSREAPGARRIGEPRHRHLMGRVFNGAVKVLAVPGYEDTQCGFKLLRADAAEQVFRAARLTGWGFDPEIIFIARKRGLVVREVPIVWHFNRDSRVRPVHDTLAMVRELLAIRANDRQGVYD
jgi:dolichyl-phosphate beta-glucosyltransferase